MPTLTPLVKRLLIVWGVFWVISFLTELAGGSLSELLALDPALLHGDLTRVPGILGYALVHDPLDVLHVAFNAYLLAVFAPEVETLWRGKSFVRFLLAVVLAGAGAHLLLALLSPGHFDSRVVGGSGIVTAVIAVNAAVYPARILNLILLRVRMLTFFLVFLGLDVLGFLALSAGRGGLTAADVHLAGAAAGWLWAGGFARFGLPGGRWAAARRGRREQRRAAARKREEAELDRILAKIAAHGMPSLSAGERRFLEKRSRRP